MSTAADELKLVHPDFHEELQKVPSSGPGYQDSQRPLETMTSSGPEHLDPHNEVWSTKTQTTTTHTESMMDGYFYRVVYVTFHTYNERKMVRMELSEHNAYEELLRKAREVMPGTTWRLYSGNEFHVESEFTNSRQVWDAMKHGLTYYFNYLEVRLIKLGETARCDGCYREIYGIRYKCTTCSDFDLCGSCEIRRMHPFHKLIMV